MILRSECKKRTWLSKMTALVLSLAMALMLGGCYFDTNDSAVIKIDADSQKNETETLHFFGYKVDANNLVAIENATHDFMDAHPDVMVVYEGLKGQDYWDALERRAATGNLDDMFHVDRDHMKQLRDEGMLQDLSGLSTLDNYSDLARSQFTEEDGSVYFLPTSIASYGLYVNEDLLEENGFSVPHTMPELTEICDYFVKQGTTPILMNNFNAFRSLVEAKSMYHIYSLDNPSAEIDKFNSGEADLAETLRPGIEMVADMIDRGWIDGQQAAETAQTSDDLELFAEGESPFLVSGGWASNRVAAKDPDYSYAVYLLPVLEDRDVLVIEMATCMSVNAEGEHVDETLEFVEFLTQPDVMWEYCDSQSSYTPMDDDRTPSDPTIAPSSPNFASGEVVMGSDFNLDLPLDSSLRECGLAMFAGASVDETMELLKELLAQ